MNTQDFLQERNLNDGGEVRAMKTDMDCSRDRLRAVNCRLVQRIRQYSRFAATSRRCPGGFQKSPYCSLPRTVEEFPREEELLVPNDQVVDFRKGNGSGTLVIHHWGYPQVGCIFGEPKMAITTFGAPEMGGT